MTRLRRWWSRRALRTRITLVVGAVALIALLALARASTGLVLFTLLGATDTELRVQAGAAAAQVSAGAGALPPPIRVVDTAGTPVDGRGPVPLDAADVGELAAGQPVTVFATGGGAAGERRALRWIAAPVTTPDGSTRLVLASADLVGGATLVARVALLSILGAFVVAAVVATTTWLATRAALAPVDRIRRAAAALPAGDRLPVPVARDEVRALAEEMNALLARRDDAVGRLERFTGDAAHELRSPVAAIRAQADVAVAHPDPARAEETLRSVAGEAERLSALIADLMALARADAGRRADAQPVDLVATTRAAVARAGTQGTGSDSPANGDSGHGPVVRLVAPTPVLIAATPLEVGLVLDNLLGNARRHARSVVRVAVLPAGPMARLVVDDDGPGIPTADRERVFDRFTRLDPAGGGVAGLGLALVAALVRGRGGTVVAGASPEGGARLEARWPVA